MFTTKWGRGQEGGKSANFTVSVDLVIRLTSFIWEIQIFSALKHRTTTLRG